MKLIYLTLFSFLYLYATVCCIIIPIVISILQAKFVFSGCGLFISMKTETEWCHPEYSLSICEYLKFSPSFIFLYSFPMFIYHLIPIVKLLRRKPQTYTVWKKPFYPASIFFLNMFIFNSCLTTTGIALSCKSIGSQYPLLSCKTGFANILRQKNDDKDDKIIFNLLILIQICYWSSSIAYVIIITASSCLIFQRKSFAVTDSIISLQAL
ncbi:uncharacterized protein LOC111623855 [Centruroides sculpturatus]|uniref:uncharacterized protein LOC111623855 n=1 Tax=Centruroides sculpturatus TaxID=218467 RepID=UPI000C6ED01F|nr:uncharacterized protein LOC111623855 [Centruroides sculpturatus]XP_023222343.1 uncharacterized protein LOC111623855 [Centruroides sculpturatus]XP_023222344.1 uncharacterized protein LOC111623855 [Centruroides sculpturatus]XP_023222345.1 uncharacterized protein LOC111623855 [Centruroides sculpturatus]